MLLRKHIIPPKKYVSLRGKYLDKRNNNTVHLLIFLKHLNHKTMLKLMMMSILTLIMSIGVNGQGYQLEHTLMAHDNMELKFPIKGSGNSGRIESKSWRFENIAVDLYENGKITVNATQSTNRCEGFTGVVFADIIDTKGNPLVRVYFKDQGVGPEFCFSKGCCKSTRTYRDIMQLDLSKYPNLLDNAQSIKVYGERRSTGKFIKYIEKNIKDYLNNRSK